MRKSKGKKIIGFSADSKLTNWLEANGFTISVNFGCREQWYHKESGFLLSGGRTPFWDKGQIFDTPEKIQHIFNAVMGYNLNTQHNERTSKS